VVDIEAHAMKRAFELIRITTRRERR
jgi:hypothetical protein